MQDSIVSLYCVCDEFLKAMNHQDDPQARLSSAEVMCVPLVAARYFGGKVERAQEFLWEHGYLGTALSKSRLNRRLHALPWSWWQMLFAVLGQVFKDHNIDNLYTVDSMPFPACDNIRIQRCRLLKEEEHQRRGTSRLLRLQAALLFRSQGASAHHRERQLVEFV